MAINKKLNQQQIKAICDVLADTNRGLTKAELSKLLQQCQIQLVDDGRSSNGHTYTIGLSKRDWLHNCLVNEINTCRSFNRIYKFIQDALNPVAFTNLDSRKKYTFLFEETNKVLLLAGLSIDKEGVLGEAAQAKTLDEVDRRVNELRSQLYSRAIHHEVEKYCIKDYLRKDYYDAVFEAAKGLSERVRQMALLPKS